MRSPVYMLAIDHRWQWEEWCAAEGIDRSRIPEVKSLAAEAFLHARALSEDVEQSGALLVDLTYGRAAFEIVQASGAVTGNPAERAGVFPLEWTAPLDQALPGVFAKVLVRHRSDLARDVVDSQRQKLLELQGWCRENGRPLVLEVLVSPVGGEEAEFDGTGRPRLLAEYIRSAYRADLVPEYWKIEGMPNAAAVGIVDEAIRTVDGPRQLILGKGAGMDQVRQWFDAAAGVSTAAGFAIGRTVYFETAADWVRGCLSREDAIAQIAANYAAVITAWQEVHGTPV